MLHPQVYTDGVLELTGQNSSAFVYVYSADADTRVLGSVFYRESTEQELLDISSDLFSRFFSAANFTSQFIVTWFYVGYYDGGVDLVRGKTATLVWLDCPYNYMHFTSLPSSHQITSSFCDPPHYPMAASNGMHAIKYIDCPRSN